MLPGLAQRGLGGSDSVYGSFGQGLRDAQEEQRAAAAACQAPNLSPQMGALRKAQSALQTPESSWAHTPEQHKECANSVAITWMMRPMRRRNISAKRAGCVRTYMAK